MLATSPEAFSLISKQKISLFHGTNANALPSILKYGIVTVDEAGKQGINISTGEPWSRVNGKRGFTSFTDNIDVALKYSAFDPLEKTEPELSFGVVLGISSKALEHLNTCPIHSDLPEIGITDTISPEDLTLFVAPDKVSFVQRIVGSKNIQVCAIDMNERFYNPVGYHQSGPNIRWQTPPPQVFDKYSVKTAATKTKRNPFSFFNRKNNFRENPNKSLGGNDGRYYS